MQEQVKKSLAQMFASYRAVGHSEAGGVPGSYRLF
jgi:hypothetical protein